MTRNPGAKVGSGEHRRDPGGFQPEQDSGSFWGNRIPLPEMYRLVHELQVHQIELEQQNEELRQARIAIEDGLARYTELYEMAPVGYLTLGEDGVIQQVNRTGLRLLGLDGWPVAAKNLRSLIAAESRGIFQNFLTRVFSTGSKEVCEITLSSGRAAAVPVEMTGQATEQGQSCRLVITDISERRRAEELQAQLFQSQKMEAVGTLAGGVAHDFNNILGGILGGLSLLDLELGDLNPHHSDIQDMMATVERGTDLTKRLLGFSRQGNYDVRPLELARVVEKTSSLFGCTRRDITIQQYMAPGLRAVLMDHTQLEQVLLNLLVNAGQAMPTGGLVCWSAENVELGVDEVVRFDVAPGRFVKLSVSDTGVGMAEGTKKRIFEPFFTTKGPGQGTGLGLASVYGILKCHSGFITVASELGRGTTFTLFLPATDHPVAEEKAPALHLTQGTGTILIVDDEAVIVKFNARLIGRMGYEVLTASGGREALEILRNHPSKISLVILDMIMPDMSGRQTFDAIQSVAPGTKVLLSSGYSIDGQAQEILARGCKGFIQKPFTAAALSEKLREIL